MSRSVYDADAAKMIARGGYSETQAQLNFVYRKEREFNSKADWSLSPYGVMRLLVGGKGYLVNRHGHPTLEYDT